MLALRRFANPIRSRSHHVRISQVCSVKQEVPVHGSDVQEQNLLLAGNRFLPKMLSPGFSFYLDPSLGYRGLSTQVGASTSDDESSSQDGFSELEEPPVTDKTEKKGHTKKMPFQMENDFEDVSVENDLDEDDKLELSDKKIDCSSLLKLLIDTRQGSIRAALDNYVKEGNPLGREEINAAMYNLRKRRRFVLALQLSEWLEESKHVDMVERDYGSRVDLIAKVNGLHKAEKYIERIPEKFKTELVYRSLMANCVMASNVKKTEEVFNKIRSLGFPLTAFACNQLLLLYKRVDRKKIVDVLLMMEKENVKPTTFTYRLLIDVKGRANDIEGVEQIIETMKAEGINPDKDIQASVARFYIYGNLSEKAESVLKEIEGDDIAENRHACQLLLPLYAALGKADEVDRIWKICEANPHADECLAAIEAWGKLGQVDKAEEVFEQVIKTWKRVYAKYYITLLKVYANHKMLNKGKELVKRMANSGCTIGPTTWDALVKLYLGAGEVEKADSVLQKAVEQSKMKPMYSSYAALLEKYAKRGDVHNAEKIFHKMRMDGYVGRMKMFQKLLDAYVISKKPVYGFRERMKADNIFPNNIVAAQLKNIEGFKKSAISELLD